MSGKFMKVKRIVIPTITMLIIASQLMGCAAASSKEMLAMLERQEAITIEVAEPISQEQGTQQTYEWVELASLDTYSDFRTTVDDILNITAHGNNGKNGILYIDLEGNHTNNSTMYFAFSNQKFIENAWNNSKILPQLLEATKAIYADVETDAVAKVAFLNAYFNILPDAEPNYFNGNQTLTRAEYLAAVYRAGTPVSALETDVEFTSLVDPLGTNENTAFANQMMDYSYLTIADESLNDKTFDGTISRAEAIYTIVRMYYNAEYESLTGKESSFSDIKNGGDILEKVGKKYLKENETTADAVKFGKSYELNYMLQNPDKGVTPELYKAMVVAKTHGLITGTECRWDEAITKAEAINILSRVYIDLGTVTNADRGNSTVEIDPVTQEMLQAEQEANEVESSLNESTGVEIVEVLDVRMYVIKAGNIREGDGTNFKVINSLMKGGTARVTGRTSNGWYEIDCGTVKGYAPAECLSLEDPSPSTELTEEQKQQKEDILDILEQLEQESDENSQNAPISDIDTGNDEDDYEGGRDLSKIDW